MADTSVIDLDADFMSFGGSDLNVLDGKVLASFPGNCCLYESVSHCNKLIIFFAMPIETSLLPELVRL